MSVILQPQVAFPLVRQIANHLDSETYYVRAVVRNAQGVTIDTVALTSQGNQRYQTSWQVPADPSGQGAYISIITSVYTDSGYTTKSPNYGDEENTYLIFDRVMPAMRGSGAGADSRTIRRIVEEVIDAKIPKPEPEEPEVEEPAEPMRWDEVLSGIEGLKTALKPEKPEKVDFKPLIKAIESLRSDVKEKEVTPVTDLSPILAKLSEKEEEDDLTRQELIDLLNSLGSTLTKKIPDIVLGGLAQSTFKIEAATANLDIPSMKREPVIFDISKISK